MSKLNIYFNKTVYLMNNGLNTILQENNKNI